MARSSAGRFLRSAANRLGVPIHADVAEALNSVGVLVEFTSRARKQLALAASSAESPS